METIVIVRRGNLHTERTIEIQRYGRRWMHIDPAYEILKATQQSYTRDYCILSLAWGMQNAGSHVFMEHHHYGKRHLHAFRAPDRGTPIYYLYGAALVRYEWPRLVASLNKLIAQWRLTALEKTAQEYWCKHIYAPLNIIIP